MKTYNIIYKDLNNLKKFININNSKDYSKILIQVLSGICDKKRLIKFTNDIKSVLPQAKIIGNASSNFMYSDSFIHDNILISITVFECTNINTHLICKNKKSSFYNCGRLLAQNLIKNNTKLLIVFVSGNEVNGNKILQGIKSVNPNITVYGGFISNNNKLNETFIFNEKNITDNGIVGVSFESNKLNIFTHSICQFLPIGSKHIITDAYNYVVNTIDEMPACEFYSKYLGIKNKISAIKMGTEIILMIVKKNKFIPIAIDGFADNGGLHLVQNVRKGDKVVIGYQCFEYILNNYKYLENNVFTDYAETVFIYTNTTRHKYIENMVMSKAINDNNVPLSMFFTYAQFYKNKQLNVYENNSFTILSLYEDSNNKNKNNSLKKFFTYQNSQNNVVLCNLIKSARKDCIEVNRILQQKIDEKADQLKSFYYTDTLTKLENRNKLINDISNKHFNKLALIEINSFNEISDFYGNWARNVILVEFSKVINNFAKKHAMKVYKIESNIFALLNLTKLRNETFIKSIREFQNSIKNHCFFYDKNRIFVSVTIGMSINQEFSIEKADMALNYAKKQYKQIQQYNEGLQIVEKFKNNLICLRKIKDALKNDRIVPYFQPIYNNVTHKLEKYEVLIRMIDEDGNLILPGSFLDAAIKAGIYNDLTKVVINKSFKIFENMDKDFSINILVDDIVNDQIRKFILNKLETYKSSKHVIFEIVESEEIENYNQVSKFIKKVHQFGGKIAVDDFGTGYSNFEYIMKLNIDYIKIDGSIIKNIVNDNSAQIITETIVNFSKKLNIYTIAEYVYNEKTYNIIKNIDIDFSQGYYLSEPKPYVDMCVDK